MSTFQKIADIIVTKCTNIKKMERVVIVTDKNKRKFANAIFDSSRKITDTVILEIPQTRFNGEDPSSMVFEILEKADVIIAPTTMSLSHTRAIVNARKHGARVATLPGITEKIFIHAIDTDYNDMSELTKKLANYCAGKENIFVTTKKGTNVEFSVKERTPLVLDGICHNKGAFVNLPDGEMLFAPVEDSVNGRIVIDLSMSPDHMTPFGKLGRLKNEVIDLDIKNGKVISFKGGKKSQILKKLIENGDANANCIAEFAFGTNKKARIIGFILEDEKALGTIHFAIGSNISIGGVNQSNLHFDGIISKPNVFVDNVQVMKNGKFLI